MLDPGPDFAKTPAQTVAVLRRLDALRELGRPLLLAASRKDFVGALTGRGPRERGAGTLAAIAHGVDAGASILRVHDVAAAADFLAVRAALRGEREVGRLEGSRPNAGLTDRRPAFYPDGRTGRRPLRTTRPGAHRPNPKKETPCLPCLTVPASSRARSPTSTCSPTSSASTASDACARPS